MGIFISVPKTIECVAIAVFFAFAMLLSSAKLLGILQSCTYSGKKLVIWAAKKLSARTFSFQTALLGILELEC